MPLCKNNYWGIVQRYFKSLAHGLVSEAILYAYALIFILLILALIFRIAGKKTFTNKILYLDTLYVFCVVIFVAGPTVILARALLDCL